MELQGNGLLPMSLDSHYDLSKTIFFKHFPDKVLRQLESSATKRKYKKNTLLITSGDDSHSAYVLITGSAHAFTEDKDGNEFILMTFQANDCFGELGILDGLQRSANVVTTSDSECLVIPGSELIKSIESTSQAALAVIKTLVGKIRGMTEDINSLALMDVYGRTIRLINSETTKNEDGVGTMSKMTHQEMANRVGSSREMVSKILKDLRKGGYIDIDNHRILVLRKLPEKW